MSNTTTDLIKNLNIVTIWINNIVPVLQIVFGTFRNLFNIIIFTRRALRTNPCSLYFLIGSINNCFVVDVALLTRYLASNWNLDPSNTNTVLCKLGNFVIYSSLTLSLWFTVLASIDRFLSSSQNARLRRMSSLPTARKINGITIILIFVMYAHILIYFRSGLSGGTISCIFVPYEYIVFLSFFGPVISCVLPITLMSIFSILTIVNVCHSRNRVVPQANYGQNERLRSNDRQLIIMLLFQVLITTLISTPYFALALYNAIAIVISHEKLSTSGQAIYNFAFNLFRLLYYTNPVLGFYIYTLTGSKFRTEMKRCMWYSLQSIYPVIGLIPCLPLRVQRVLLNQNQTNSNTQPMAPGGITNTVNSNQNRRSMNIATVV